MKKYQSLVQDKKKLIRKVEAIVGCRAAYTYVPRCAYQVENLFIEKDGNLTTENEEATKEIIARLQAEGLIGEEMPEEAAPARVRIIRASRNAPDISQPTNTNYFEPVTETWQPEVTSEEAQENENSRAWEFPSFTIPVRRTEEAEQMQSIQESTADSGEAEEEKQNTAVGSENAEETSEHETFEEESIEVETQEDTGFPMDAKISFPLSKHTGTSMINLINTIYSRGSLLSKATAGEFHCNEEFIKELGFENGLYQPEQVMAFIKDYEELHGRVMSGLIFTDKQVIFDGFKAVPDEEHLKSFTVLAEKINKMCILQNRVQAKEVDESNERYALRTWLNRLGMKGMEYKVARKHLMEHLSGHTAFRTKEEEERAKQKALKNKAKG